MNRRRALLLSPVALAALAPRRTAAVGEPVYLAMVRAEPSPPPALPAGMACRVVWVWPRGETLTTAEATAARWELQQALAYWNACGDRPGLFVAREEALRIDDPYATWQWLRGLALPDVLTIAVVVNQASRRYVDLGGGVQAPAYNWPGKRACYASLRSDLTDLYSGVGVGALVAHELGHALYGLPEGDPSEPMMGDYHGQWGRWVARCSS